MQNRLGCDVSEKVLHMKPCFGTPLSSSHCALAVHTVHGWCSQHIYALHLLLSQVLIAASGCCHVRCCCCCRYTGDACDQCLASYWPHSGQCLPQYISGRNIFDPITLQGDEQFAGLVFLILAAVAGAAVVASGVWVLWRWLVLGRPPKPGLALHRLLRAIRAALVGSGGGAAVPADGGVSRNYLLDVELELSGKAVPHGKTQTGGIEDAAAWSKVGMEQQRPGGVGRGRLRSPGPPFDACACTVPALRGGLCGAPQMVPALASLIANQLDA